MRIFLTSVEHLDGLRHAGGEPDTRHLVSAYKHMAADCRNAVVVDGHKYRTAGWAGGEYDDRVEETAPDGARTYHATAADALRKHRR